jgi:hypothetical protein
MRLPGTKVLCADQRAAHWVRRAPCPDLFPCPVRWFRSTVPLSSIDPRFILPCPVSPSEFLRFNSRPAAFGARLPARVSFPHRDTTRARPLATGVPKSLLRSVLRCSQPLDGLLRAPARRAYSIPLPRSGLHARPRASLCAQPPSLIGRSFPLAVGRPDAHRIGSLSQTSSAATTDRLGFEAFFRVQQRIVELVISLLSDRSLPRVLLLQVASPRRSPSVTQGIRS